MKPLTLFIIPSHKREPKHLKRCAESFGNVVHEVRVVDKPAQFDKLFAATPWIGFVYSSEELDDLVRDRLEDTYLVQSMWAWLSLFSESNDGKYYQQPRFFKSDIPLQPGAPYPINIEEFEGTMILDGMLREQSD